MLLSPNHMMVTLLLAIFAILLYPVITSFSPTPQSPNWAVTQVKTAVKLAFFVSLLPLSLYLSLGMETVISTWPLLNIPGLTVNVSFKFDFYSLVFIPIALYVTWAILEFAAWYMHSDPHMNRFFKYLLVFLMAMIILVTANNLFQLFIGWEGVGIMSVLLIGWWWARADATTAAMQAILYNRAGDIGFIFAIAWTATNINTWELDQVLSIHETEDITYLLIALIIAAAAKSAQFGFHPWLPSAMEGPTPVSALLHSSTMVVAGIFLLIRFSPLLEKSPLALNLCLWLGALSTFYAAFCALTQNDIKKIVAYSTSSQLGLMMVAIGLNQPHLAFLHICTHAFFKAMLFMCSGSIIHSLNDEQDIRKMGGMHNLTPLTSSALTLGSLALTGVPFLSGFFSKDAIVEALTTSHTNAWALALTLLAISFTAVYSLRVIYFVSMGHPRFNPISPINENNPSVINPLKRLGWGSLVAGLFLTSSLLLPSTPVMTLSLPLKLSALLVTGLGLTLALTLAKRASAQHSPTPKVAPYTLSNLLVYYSALVNRVPSMWTLLVGTAIAFQLFDWGWFKKIGPKALTLISTKLSSITSNAQRGAIKVILATFFLSLTIALLLQPLTVVATT